MKREEYLPPTDPDSPSMESARSAIETVHILADQKEVFDGWPIDDPIREAALCTISAVQLKAGDAVGEALTKLPLEEKRALVDTICSVIEISVDKINHAGDNVHHIGIPAENSNALPKMAPFEQIKLVADAAYWISDHWAKRTDQGLGQQERVHGAVHEVLSMLQNGNEMYEIPAFHLIPIDPETESGCVATIDRDGDRVAAEWNFGQPFSPTYHPPMLYGHDAKHPPGSLTDRYQNHYELMRERYRTSALDLFGDPSDD